MHTPTSLLPTATSIILTVFALTSLNHAHPAPVPQYAAPPEDPCENPATLKNTLVCPPQLPKGQNSGDYIPYPAYDDKQSVHCAYDQQRAAIVEDIKKFANYVSTFPADGPAPPEIRANHSGECTVVGTVRSARVSICREPGQPEPKTNDDAPPLVWNRLLGPLEDLLNGVLCGPRPVSLKSLRRGVFVASENSGVNLLLDNPAAPEAQGEGGLWGEVFREMGGSASKADD
ncbi:MAG: hypothetical protein M1831_003860 [Alyxoria varia]|nr:MAG: hypothetical protein M1831_003860 [Alyxoria varia]